MIIFLGPTPAWQRTMAFDRLVIDGVNRSSEVSEYASGKSVNAARVAHTLGRKVLAMGFAGGARGEQLTRDLETVGIQHEFVRVRPETRQCLTILDRSNGSATELIEESSPLADEDYEALQVRLEDALDDVQVLVLSGSLPPNGPPDLYARLVTLAKTKHVRTIVDARDEPLRLAANAGTDVCKLNVSELLSSTGRSDDSEQGIADAIRLMLAGRDGWVIVTHGAQPTLVGDREGVYRLTTPRVNAISPIGSGDAFAAGLACGLADGMTLPDAARLASACGSANAMTPRAGFIDPTTVDQLQPQVSWEKLQ